MNYSNSEIILLLTDRIEELCSRLSFTVDLNQKKELERQIKIAMFFKMSLEGAGVCGPSKYYIDAQGQLVVYNYNWDKCYEVTGVLEANGMTHFKIKPTE